MQNTEKITNARCVILGANGFIGINLAKALSGQVSYLRAFGRDQTPPKILQHCDWVSGDFTRSGTLGDVIADCDIVFHLINSGAPVDNTKGAIKNFENDVISTLHLLEECVQRGVQRIIFASSGGTIYGVPEKIPTPETASTNPISSYGISKLAIEKYLALYETLYGLEYRSLRISNPFGPFQLGLKNQGAIATFIRRAIAGDSIEIWGDGSTVRDYIYIDDVINAMLMAIKHDGTERVFNIGSGEGRCLNEVIAGIANELSGTINVKYINAREGDIPVNILDNRLAQKNLEWRVRVPFEIGIKQTISWMIEHGMEH